LERVDIILAWGGAWIYMFMFCKFDVGVLVGSDQATSGTTTNGYLVYSATNFRQFMGIEI
jgi:hypothetical protein